MTRTRKINLYKKREKHDSPSGRFIAPEAYEQLVGEFPQFVVPPNGTAYSYFEVELPADDPRLAEVMHFIEHEAGVKPCIYKSERKRLEEHRAFLSILGTSMTKQTCKMLLSSRSAHAGRWGGISMKGGIGAC